MESNDKEKEYVLDSLLTTEIRFFIMSILAMYDEVDFNFLKNELGATDGNLSANITKLENAGYLKSRKEFVAKRPRTSYRITPEGLKKLEKYIEAVSRVKEKFMKREAGPETN